MSATSHSDPLDRLTPRERDVLHHVAQGHTNAAIAARLHVSQSAVEKHINTIFDKLACPTRPATAAESSRSCTTSAPSRSGSPTHTQGPEIERGRGPLW
ncbi:MAG: helix-turn-helix transcriptional regulator [Actinoplanes sp.]